MSTYGPHTVFHRARHVVNATGNRGTIVAEKYHHSRDLGLTSNNKLLDTEHAFAQFSFYCRMVRLRELVQ